MTPQKDAAVSDEAEKIRLETLSLYRILDTAAEKVFDDLTRLAATIDLSRLPPLVLNGRVQIGTGAWPRYPSGDRSSGMERRKARPASVPLPF